MPETDVPAKDAKPGQGSDASDLLGPAGLMTRVYQLSHVSQDDILAVLSGLGYQTLEANAPSSLDSTDLPAIIAMPEAEAAEFTNTDSSGMPSEKPHPLTSTNMAAPASGGPRNRILLVYRKDDRANLDVLVERIVDQIDLPARQVFLEAMVVEVESDFGRDLGVSFSHESVQGGTAVSGSLFPQNASSGDVNLPFVLKVADAINFSMALSASVASGEAEILSRPSVLVLEGRPARIEISENIPYISEIVQGEIGQNSSLSWLPIGILLNFKPEVSGDGSEIRLRMETIVSHIVGSIPVTTAGGQSVLVAPSFESAHVQSYVRVESGSTFIVAGLTSVSRRGAKTGIPFLSRIRGIGGLFRRTQMDRRRKELAIIVTPHLIEPRTEKTALTPQSGFEPRGLRQRVFPQSLSIPKTFNADLERLAESASYRELRRQVEKGITRIPGLAKEPPFTSILEGHVPGELLLLKDSLSLQPEIVELARSISPDRIQLLKAGEDGQEPKTILLSDLLEENRRGIWEISFNDREGVRDHLLFGRPAISRFTRDCRSDKTRVRAPAAVVLKKCSRREAFLAPLQMTLLLRHLMEANGYPGQKLGGFLFNRELRAPDRGEVEARIYRLDDEIPSLLSELERPYVGIEAALRQVADRVALMISQAISSPTQVRESNTTQHRCGHLRSPGQTQLVPSFGGPGAENSVVGCLDFLPTDSEVPHGLKESQN